jgi:membrane protease YdiL (CAAX protease family)
MAYVLNAPTRLLGRQTISVLFIYLLLLLGFHGITVLIGQVRFWVADPAQFLAYDFYIWFLVAKYVLIITIGTVLIHTISKKELEMDWLGLNPERLPSDILFSIQVFLVFPGILLVIHLVTVLLPESIISVYLFNLSEAASITYYPGWFAAELFAAVLCIPIIEEIVFRGFLFSVLEKRIPVVITVIITTVIFTCYHINPFALHQLVLSNLLLIVFGGLGCGILRGITKRLWAPIVYHVLWNAAIYSLYYWRWMI